MNAFRKTLAAVVIGGTGVAAWLVGSSLIQNVRFARAKEEVQATREQLATVQDLATVFKSVGRVVEPSVVNIQVKKSVKTGQSSLPFDPEQLKKYFKDHSGDGLPDLPEGFGDGKGDDEGTMEQVGTGSGVIMEVQGTQGFILTNNHVAGGATELTVTLDDGRVIKGADVKVLGTDSKTDLAVVQIKADHLIAAQWGDSDQLQRGDWIMAFGSPFGYVGSMTHGIVSALHRQAGILANEQGYENFIQVDAPINPGNSGGPLVDIRGNVVGINTAIASRSGGFQGIGFAIPSSQAKIIYAGLKEHGKIVRGWLGVSISDVARDLDMIQKSFGYTGTKGVLVQETFDGTPATGKLQKGDIITALDGKEVDNTTDLRNIVAMAPPGTQMTFTVFRDGKTVDVKIKLGEQPDNLMAMTGRSSSPEAVPAPSASSKAAESLGLRLATIDEQTAQQLNLPDGFQGALVVRVTPRSPAYKAGIREGDVITQVGRKDVANAADALAAIGKLSGKGVRLYIATPSPEAGKLPTSRFVFVEPAEK